MKDGEPNNITKDQYSGYTGYKPQAIIDLLSKHLFGQWGFRELETHTTKDDKGSLSLAISKVEVWIEGVEFKPAAWGQSRITRGDIGDAKKGAQTDAIKKALSYFSIGNRAYHGKLEA